MPLSTIFQIYHLLILIYFSTYNYVLSIVLPIGISIFKSSYCMFQLYSPLKNNPGGWNSQCWLLLVLYYIYFMYNVFLQGQHLLSQLITEPNNQCIVPWVNTIRTQTRINMNCLPILWDTHHHHMLIYPSRECLTGNLLIEEICLRIYLTKLTEEIHVILHAQHNSQSLITEDQNQRSFSVIHNR